MTFLVPSSSGSRSTLLLGSALAAATVVLGMPATAHANSCEVYPTHVLPLSSTPDVPTNTRIWYAGQSLQSTFDATTGDLLGCDDPPRLVDADGVEVSTAARSFSFAYVLVPDAPLVQGATYSIEHGCLNSVVSFGEAMDGVTTFTVTAAADDEPPAQPDLAIGETQSIEYDDFVSYSLPVEGELEGSILVVDIGDEATLDPAALTVEVSLASTDTEFVIGDACVPTWREAEPGASTTVAFASFDLAGNFSGWTEPEPVTVEGDEGCQCRTGPGGGSTTALGLGLLVLLGLRRHRRPDVARTACR
jgi:MYXO-CTERM domain-containing protein